LSGSKRRLITGFAKIEKTVSPAAAKSKVSAPLAKTIPDANVETKYKAVRSIR